MRRLLKPFVAGLFLVAVGHEASSWSLSGKATDESVCDLSPLTSYRLASKTFVEAETRRSDEIYARLALRQITQNCRNGQLLVLDSEDGDAFDARYFNNVAARVCAVADIKRVATGTSRYPEAFQVRCVILKAKEAAEWLAYAEATESTEAMIAEGAPPKTRSTSEAGQGSRNDCDRRPTFASIFFGGGCK